MNPNQIAAYKLLEQAQQALKSGDKTSAGQLAAQAVQLAPDLEEVWLLMAALATPQDSIAYLERALQINPQSERAIKGMAWAKKRLGQDITATTSTNATIIQTPPARDTLADTNKTIVASQFIQETPPQPAAEPANVTMVQESQVFPQENAGIPASSTGDSDLVSSTQPRKVIAPQSIEAQANSAPVTPKKDLAMPRISFVVPLALILCLLLVFLAWQGVIPVSAYFTSTAFSGQQHGAYWAQVNLPTPDASQALNSLTTLPTASPATTDIAPTSEAAATLPADQSQTPASDQGILSTDTPVVVTATQQAELVLPTVTSTPEPASATPIQPTPIPASPTNSPVPTSTLTPIAAVPASTQVASSSDSSPTPLPTDTGVPGAVISTPSAFSTPAVASTTGSGHWIDVDLTHQMVYAYDGTTVVNSFLVSTGTWAHPTVTGQYHVYVKYRYTDMSGPGYYLPNVPFTMYFYQGYGLHGTYWHHNFGTPMSHGCVNLSIPDSEWLYNFSVVGTLVNIHY